MHGLPSTSSSVNFHGLCRRPTVFRTGGYWNSSATTLLQKGMHPNGLLKSEFAGEELEQLHRKKIIQLLNVTLP